jgi:hypothetical protein
VYLQKPTKDEKNEPPQNLRIKSGQLLSLLSGSTMVTSFFSTHYPAAAGVKQTIRTKAAPPGSYTFYE